MLRPPAALAVVVSTLAIAACGDDDERPADFGQTGNTAPPAQTTAPGTTAREGGDLTDTESKPAIPKPTGSPPKKLEKKDIVRGEGRPVKKGDKVTVQYVGVSYSTGEEFDASWDRGEPFPFEVGGGEVIEGWDVGVVGMKKGGRRQLTIPPDQAYGPEGQPPSIGPNETLVFVIDLVSIE